MKRNGNPERRRRENQGAEGVGSGVSPLQWGRGLPISFFDFFSGNGAFCRALACFNVSIRRVKQSKGSSVCQMPIGQLSHMADVSSMISYT